MAEEERDGAQLHTGLAGGEAEGDGSENEVEDEEYNRPLDPDTDDEKIRQLLRKHRRAFSVLRLGPHHIWGELTLNIHANSNQ